MRDETAKRERKMRVNRTARHGGRGGGASLSGKSSEGEAYVLSLERLARNVVVLPSIASIASAGRGRLK